MTKNVSIFFNLLCCLVLGACLAQPAPNPDTSTTIETTAWLTYTDEQAGYSFKYPPEKRFFISKAGYSNFNDARVVFIANERAVSIEAIVLENNEQLPLEDFVRTKDVIRLIQPSDKWPVPQAEPYLKSTNLQGFIEAIEVEQSDATQPLTRICRYDTYIAHEDLVISIAICPGGRNPLSPIWDPPPDGLAIYRQILDTVELSPEGTDGP